MELSAASFGADGLAWRRLGLWAQQMGERLAAALLAACGTTHETTVVAQRGSTVVAPAGAKIERGD